MFKYLQCKYLSLFFFFSSLVLILNERFNVWFKPSEWFANGTGWVYLSSLVLVVLALLAMSGNLWNRFRRSESHVPLYLLIVGYFSCLLTGWVLNTFRFEKYITNGIVAIAFLLAFLAGAYILIIALKKEVPESWSPKRNTDDDGLGFDIPPLGGFKKTSENVYEFIVKHSNLNRKSKARGADNAKVYALLGEWGSGKTYFWELVENKLHENYEKQTHVIHVNPWQIFSENSEADIPYALLKCISNSIADKFYVPLFRLKSRIYMSKLFPNIELSAYGFKLSNLLTPFLDNRLDAVKLMENAIKDIGQKVIVVMDDMDRLTPKETLTLLKFVRTTLHLKNVSVICCLDEEKCYKSLIHEKIEGVYIQKVFTHQYHVPKIEYSEIKRVFLEHLKDISKTHDSDGLQRPTWKIDDNYKQKCLDVDALLSQKFTQDFLRNMRHVKKILLSFMDYKEVLFRPSEFLPEFHQLNLADWLCLEMIRIHSNPAYEFLKKGAQGRYYLYEQEHLQKEPQSKDKQSMLKSFLLEVLPLKETSEDDDSDKLKSAGFDDFVRDGIGYLLMDNSHNAHYKFSDLEYRGNYFSYKYERGYILDQKSQEGLDKSDINSLSLEVVSQSYSDDFAKYIKTLVNKSSNQVKRKILFSSLLHSLKSNEINVNYKAFVFDEIKELKSKITSSFSKLIFPVDVDNPPEPLEVFQHALYASNILVSYAENNSKAKRSLGEAMLSGNIDMLWLAEYLPETKFMFEGLNLTHKTSIDIAAFAVECYGDHLSTRYKDGYKYVSENILSNLDNGALEEFTEHKESVSYKNLTIHFLRQLTKSSELGSRENILYKSESPEIQKMAIDKIAPLFSYSDELSGEEGELLYEGYRRIYSNNGNDFGEAFAAMYHCNVESYAKFKQHVYTDKENILDEDDIASYIQFRHAVKHVRDLSLFEEWKSMYKLTNESSPLNTLLHSIDRSYLVKVGKEVSTLNSELKKATAASNLEDRGIVSYMSNAGEQSPYIETAYKLYQEYFSTKSSDDHQNLVDHINKDSHSTGLNPIDKMFRVIKSIENIQDLESEISAKQDEIASKLSELIGLVDKYTNANVIDTLVDNKNYLQDEVQGALKQDADASDIESFYASDPRDGGGDDLFDVEDAYFDNSVEIQNVKITSLNSEKEATLSVECDIQRELSFSAYNAESYMGKDPDTKEAIMFSHGYNPIFERLVTLEIELYFDDPSQINEIYINDVHLPEDIEDLSTYEGGDLVQKHEDEDSHD